MVAVRDAMKKWLGKQDPCDDEATEASPPAEPEADAPLQVDLVRSDGEVHTVTVHEAMAVYERRLEQAEEEAAHCRQRLEELQSRWEHGVRSRVLRTDDSARIRTSSLPTLDPDAEPED